MIKCDPRARARCPFKKQCCGDDVAYFVEGSECDEFNKQLLAQPPTNADRIRAVSDEELAENRCVEIKGLYPWPIFVAFDVPEKQFLTMESAAVEELNWLQQPTEEDNDDNHQSSNEN